MKVNFKAAGRITNLFGENTIRTYNSAIIELVKNSHDADSTEVHIEIDKEKGIISISDNGTGMSKEDILSKWLVIGTDSKLNNKNTSGSKGLGRFAMEKLSNSTKIITRKSKGYKMVIDWNKLNSPKDLTEIKFDLTDAKRDENGTTIIMDMEKSTSDNLDIDSIERNLSLLFAPNNRKFSIFLNGKLIKYNSDDIKNNLFDAVIKFEVKDSKIMINIESDEFSLSGNDIDSNLKDSINLIIKKKKMNKIIKSHSITNGVNGTLFFKKKSYKDSSRSGKLFFYNKKAKTDISPGVSLYSNGVRIKSFGEETSENFDWLGLESRYRRKNFSAFDKLNRVPGVRSYMMYGHISVINSKDRLKERADRESVVENKFFNDLKKIIVDEVINSFETYRSELLIRIRNSQTSEDELKANEITAKAKSGITLTKSESKFLGERFDIVSYNNFNEALEKAARLSMSIFVLSAAHSFKSNLSRARMKIYNHNKFKAPLEVDKLEKNILGALDKIDSLIKLSQSDDKGGLGDIINDVVLESNDMFHSDVKVLIDDSINGMKVSSLFFRVIIMNLVDNSMKHNDYTDRGISLSMKTKGTEIILEFCDNGIGIPDDKHIWIFGERTTTSSEGTGLGLWLIKSMCDERGLSVTSEISDGAKIVIKGDKNKWLY